MTASDLCILGIKTGHDGSVALIQNGELIFSLESEKDNGRRYSELMGDTLLKIMSMGKALPNVLAYGGWSDGADPEGSAIESGYTDTNGVISRPMQIWGEKATYFSSSHARSHLMCGYGLSPWEQGRACYVLLWEGYLGAWYFINEKVEIKKICDVMTYPGVRYAFLFGLADPDFNLKPGSVRLSDAGKLMAIASYATSGDTDEDGKQVIRQILSSGNIKDIINKNSLKTSKYYNCGVMNPEFANLAKTMSDSIYSRFEDCAKSLIHQYGRHPLIIVGGCGLNCEWNSKWSESHLFEDVFIPPCANDSGSAIGTAIDAQYFLTGHAKLKWKVYSGDLPNEDTNDFSDWDVQSYSAKEVAKFLAEGLILGWMRGQYEMGPRALGARSILASPLTSEMLKKLNEIKRRENYRPIAPICLDTEMEELFGSSLPSPYMLLFKTVNSRKIPAVTHVDNSARPQSVSQEGNPELFQLLVEFKKNTGVGALCNTSLNFNGSGFLNRLSDLMKFSIEHGLDGFVFEDRVFMKKTIKHQHGKI
ncbi:carbamoyltransferase C-terminal domain-containing protein [Acidovorax sp. NCPPB 3576]|uniref:carbamoyltransferase C-terminal domain-containing protein n=1 Tax=Acidovorax sp. NCPPB 3576 TaxID=2940488 RepID=UPI0023490956|nr:carbamoyltransferase C-terminal domain-containing protein [Acidovorax sp. NCPPB 3576]WCM88191.1 proline dehydrogenase [Acidovorax sp. NCPPB 3576]